MQLARLAACTVAGIATDKQSTERILRILQQLNDTELAWAFLQRLHGTHVHSEDGKAAPDVWFGSGATLFAHAQCCVQLGKLEQALQLCKRVRTIVAVVV